MLYVQCILLDECVFFYAECVFCVLCTHVHWNFFLYDSQQVYTSLKVIEGLCDGNINVCMYVRMCECMSYSV